MHPDWLSNAYVVADARAGTAVFVDAGRRPGAARRGGRAWGATPAAHPPHARAPRPRRLRGRAARALRHSRRRRAGRVGLRRDPRARRRDAGALRRHGRVRRRRRARLHRRHAVQGRGRRRRPGAGPRLGDGRLHGAARRDARAARPHRRDDDRPRARAQPVRPRLVRAPSRRARERVRSAAATRRSRLVARLRRQGQGVVRFDDGREAIVGGSRVER